MTKGKRVEDGAESTIRQSEGNRRKMVVLVPAVLGLCLVMALSACLTVGATPARSAPLTTAGIAGDTVGIQCLHGTVYLNGTSFCHDSSYTAQVLCAWDGVYPLYNCWYTMSFTPDSGYGFTNWSASSDAYLGSVGTEGTHSTANPTTFWASTCTASCEGALVASAWPVYSVTFTESGLGTGLTWSACVGSSCQSAAAGSHITISNVHGSNSWSVGDVTVECEHGTCSYYAPTPSSGTVTGATDISVSFKLKVT